MYQLLQYGRQKYSFIKVYKQARHYRIPMPCNGNITVYLATFVNGVSSVVMNRFPFDTQYMLIGQSPSLLSIQEMDGVVIEPPSLDDEDGYFKGNSEFDFISVTANYSRYQEEGITQFAIDYIFALKRKTTYYTTVIVIPVFLAMIIDVFGVFSPGTSKGENVVFK
uniref:Uncharacterized protein n=1 Tax=Acrobeloides nanus TaxID=290746 RepID=A0A914D663_9BILA